MSFPSRAYAANATDVMSIMLPVVYKFIGLSFVALVVSYFQVMMRARVAPFTPLLVIAPSVAVARA